MLRENERLRKENRILREEREVLKKAAMFFAAQKPRSFNILLVDFHLEVSRFSE